MTKRFLLALLSLAISLGAGLAPTAAKDGKDWSGWWFIYQKRENGELALEKITTAMVIEDRAISGIRAPLTGLWSGCIWLAVTKYRLDRDTASLTFTPPGTRYTFKMTRTGPEEAQGVYTNNPKVTYVVKRHKEHGECAGYNP